MHPDPNHPEHDYRHPDAQWPPSAPYPGHPFDGAPPPLPPRNRRGRVALIVLAGIVVVAIAAIGVGVTASRDGTPSSAASESPEIPAPSVGDCVEFTALPSGTRLTTPRSCESVEATLQVTQIIRPVDGRVGGSCPESEFFSTLPTYTTGAVRRPTGDLITCYEPNFREGQCYRLGERPGIDVNFETLRDTQCSRGTFRVLRRADGNATDAACAGLQGDYTIQNFTRPPRTFCYVENR